MKTLAVILARGGSKGIPKKNIKIMNGKPLIYWTIKAALNANIFDEVVVSTDSEEIAKIAKECGALVPFIRPGELAQDHVFSRDAVKHAVLECEKIYNKIYDYVFELPCVSPLRDENHIREAYEKLVKTNADSVTAVYKLDGMHPLRIKKIENDLIKDYYDEYPEGEASRRQDLQKCYIRNGSIYSMKRDVIVNQFSRYGTINRPYIMSDKVSIDIDTELDFQIAEIMLKNKLQKI